MVVLREAEDITENAIRCRSGRGLPQCYRECVYRRRPQNPRLGRLIFPRNRRSFTRSGGGWPSSASKTRPTVRPVEVDQLKARLVIKDTLSVVEITINCQEGRSLTHGGHRRDLPDRLRKLHALS